MDRIELSKELHRDEGLRLKPYRDILGVLTIGVGRNLEDKGISDAEAHLMLMNDIREVALSFNIHIPWWTQLPEDKQHALCNMAFQLGVDKAHGKFYNFKKFLSKLEAAVTRGQSYDDAADEALDSRWARQTPERAKRVTDRLRAKGK